MLFISSFSSAAINSACMAWSCHRIIDSSKGSRTQIIERDAPWRSRAQRMLIDALIKSLYCIHVENMHIELINVYSRTNWVNNCIYAWQSLDRSHRWDIWSRINMHTHVQQIYLPFQWIEMKLQPRDKTGREQRRSTFHPKSCTASTSNYQKKGLALKGDMAWCIMLARLFIVSWVLLNVYR